MGRRMIWIPIMTHVQADGGPWWQILKTPKKNWSCWTIRKWTKTLDDLWNWLFSMRVNQNDKGRT